MERPRLSARPLMTHLRRAEVTLLVRVLEPPDDEDLRRAEAGDAGAPAVDDLVAVGVAEERRHLPFLPVRVRTLDHLPGAIAQGDLEHPLSVDAAACAAKEGQPCGFPGADV